MIRCEGNVEANYMMNSEVYCSGKVIISGSKGVITEGITSARLGVETFHVGNSTGVKTIIDVGRNDDYY